MRVKVPEIKKCCFCIPLRPGIILSGYINIVFSLFALTCLVVTVELKKKAVTNDASMEAVTATVLFCILGMSVLLNAMLLVAGFQVLDFGIHFELRKAPWGGYTAFTLSDPTSVSDAERMCKKEMYDLAFLRKDIPMLRLYNYFALATTFAMLVPALVLLFRQQFIECWAAFIAIVMQCYVIVLVRSEVIRLEIKLYRPRERTATCSEEVVEVPDTEILI